MIPYLVCLPVSVLLEVSQHCRYFDLQFTLAEKTGLPLFLHMRAACTDFISIWPAEYTHKRIHVIDRGDRQ
jgi:Tat protein secretion system quality control protein TatD with DNase activity